MHEKAFVQDCTSSPYRFALHSLSLSFPVIGEANNIANLHVQISSCDKILEVISTLSETFFIRSRLSVHGSYAEKLSKQSREYQQRDPALATVLRRVEHQEEESRARSWPTESSRRRNGRAAIDDTVRQRDSLEFFHRDTYVRRIIMDVPVTERQFLEQLHELSHKIKFVKEQSFHDAIACQDVQEVLEKLRTKVRRATAIDRSQLLSSAVDH